MRDGWERVELGELCGIQQGKRVEHLPVGEAPFPVLGATGVLGSWTEPSYDRPVIALGCRGTVGTVRYVAEPSWFGNNVMAVWPLDLEKLHSRFLALSLEWTDLAAAGAIGGQVQKQITRRSLVPVKIQLPPIREQERIDDLIAAVDETIEKADRGEKQLREAIRRIRDVVLWSAHERVPVGTLFQVDGSLVSPVDALARLPHVGTDRIESGSGAVFGVRTAAEDGVTSGKYRFNERHVVYSKIRPNLQKVAIPTFHGLCSADAYPLLPKEGVPRRYLQQLLLSTPFTEQAVARSGRTKMPKINRVELESIPVPVHSAAEMHEWAGLFEALDRAATDARAEVSSLRDMRSNLLSALLSGEHVIPESYDEVMGVVSNVVE